MANDEVKNGFLMPQTRWVERIVARSGGVIFALSHPRGWRHSFGMGQTSSGEENEGDDSTSGTQVPVVLHAAPHSEHRPLRGRVLEWLGEIVVVFVGVYAAFLLNAWQTQRHDRGNHLLILQSLDEELSDSVKNARQVAAASQTSFDEFQRQLSAGEMPALRLIAFATDYDPSDDVALSQAGADHLLNFKTVEALKKLSSVEREGLMLLHNRQQLGNELIAPRLNEPKESFYDPRTKQLQPMFAWYLTAKEEAAKFAHDYLTASEALLEQVRTERATLR